MIVPEVPGVIAAARSVLWASAALNRPRGQSAGCGDGSAGMGVVVPGAQHLVAPSQHVPGPADEVLKLHGPQQRVMPQRNQRDGMLVDKTGLHHLFGAACRPFAKGSASAAPEG